MTRTYAVRVTPELHAWIKARADKEGRNMGGLVGIMSAVYREIGKLAAAKPWPPPDDTPADQQVMAWIESGWGEVERSYGDGGWRWLAAKHSRLCRMPVINATHYMLLPTPPTEGGTSCLI